MSTIASGPASLISLAVFLASFHSQFQALPVCPVVAVIAVAGVVDPEGDGHYPASHEADPVESTAGAQYQCLSEFIGLRDLVNSCLLP